MPRFSKPRPNRLKQITTAFAPNKRFYLGGPGLDACCTLCCNCCRCCSYFCCNCWVCSWCRCSNFCFFFSLAFCCPQLLVFLLLLLLELFSFLLLLRGLLFLLLLEFLVLLRVARVGCGGPLRRRQVVRMDGVTGSRNIVRGAALTCTAAGGCIGPPASLAGVTSRPLNSPGLAVAAIGGLPMFTEARSCGLARAACTCCV